MATHRLLQLAQDLEWLGCEEEYYEKQSAGPALDAFMEKQREVLSTANKIERELVGAVRFNPAPLMGIEYPIEATLDSLTDMVATLEDIKQSAVDAVHELPLKVRRFNLMVQTYLGAAAPLTA